MRPDAADAEQRGMIAPASLCVLIRLDHADQAMTIGHRVVDHRQIARLENVERHLPARQQKRARQRKHRHDMGQIGRPAIDGVHRHERSSDHAS